MKILLGILTLALTFNAFANNKVIYGDDNRTEVINASSKYRQLARSTAAMVPESKLNYSDLSERFNLDTSETLEGRGICSNERFAQQPTVALCSGFLIAEDVLVTAGHCIKDMTDCTRNKWVFDYKITNGNDVNTEINKDNVYSCKSILAQKLENNGQDYAVIKLDRAVYGREPLKFRRDSKVTAGTSILVIGHPSGLPTKIADDANIREISENGYFVTNLDTYGGNSGSAVINKSTGEVEGILVRGEKDYEYNYQAGCAQSNRCSNSGCRGEDVTTITSIGFIQNNF